MGGSSKNPLIQLSTVQGVNYDSAKRLPSEALDAKNCIWNAYGLNVWGADGYHETVYGNRPVVGIFSTVWADGHDSLMVVSGKKLYVKEAGAITTLKLESEDGSTTENIFSNNRERFVWFSRAPVRDLVFFGQLGSGDVYQWDGDRTHHVTRLDLPTDASGAVEWQGRILYWGDPDNPLLIYYSELQSDEVSAANFIRLGDASRASRIVAVKNLGPSLVVLADRGVWTIQYTGQYPFFYAPTLLSSTTSCVAPRSVLDAGGMLAWWGEDNIYAFTQGQILELRYSRDARHADRIGDIIRDINNTKRHRICGFWHPQRHIAVWAWPYGSAAAERWKAIAYDPASDAWWPLTYGWGAVTTHNSTGRDEIVGGIHDGTVQIDTGDMVNYDGTVTPWDITVGGTVDGIRRIKFMRAAIARPYTGTDRVTLDFWSDFCPRPNRKFTSVKHSYDRGASVFPHMNAGGADGYDGTPPDGQVVVWADIHMVGTKLIVRVSNDDGQGQRPGPPIPVSALTITGAILA